MIKPCFILSLLILSTVQAQFQQVWQVEQNWYESGNTLFDVNNDGVVDLTKQLGPYITVYDGTSNYAVLWSVSDPDYEYLTLVKPINISNSNPEYVVLSSDIWSQYRFRVHLFPAMAENPLWSTADFDGYLSGIDAADLNNDGHPEIIFGCVTAGSDDSSSVIYILDGVSGETLWQSEEYAGYITGPYTGDPDGDQKIEILLNRYDLVGNTFVLQLLETDTDSCGSGDFNQDGDLDVLDIVSLLSCILAGCDYTDHICDDVTLDGSIDILDIVTIVDWVLNGHQHNSVSVVTEWSVDQEMYESGNIEFDLNGNGSPELIKFWLNTVTVYNGAENYQIEGYFVDNSVDYLSLQWFDPDFVNGSSAGIFLHETVVSDTAFFISLQDPGMNIPFWNSTAWNGFFTRIQTTGENSDNPLFVIGRNEFVAADNRYLSDVSAVSATDGSINWDSEEFSGYIIGPYTGDINGNGSPDILVNLYDTENQTSWLILYEESPDSQSGYTEAPSEIYHNDFKVNFPIGNLSEQKLYKIRIPVPVDH